MTGEEYFDRVCLILKDYGKAKINPQDDFQGFIPVLTELNNSSNGLTAGEIAKTFHVSTARVASMLNSLEAKNYVVRKKDLNDKRITIVLITDSGKDFLNNFKLDRIKQVGLAIKDIPDNELEIYFSVIEKLLKNLCKKEDKNA